MRAFSGLLPRLTRSARALPALIPFLAACAAQAGDAPMERCLKLQTACAPRPPAACQMGSPEGAPDTEPAACASAREKWLSCNDKLVKSCGPGLDYAGNSGKTVLGTVWDGTGLNDGHYIFRFEKDGILNYTTPTGTWTSGRWVHSNGTVVVSMNEGFAIYIGETEKNVLSGFADNTRGETWDWRLVLE